MTQPPTLPAPLNDAPGVTTGGIAGETPILIRRDDDSFWGGPISAYADGGYRDGDLVPSLDPGTRSSSWAPVLGVARIADVGLLLHIKTESGRRLVVALDTGLATMGP